MRTAFVERKTSETENSVTLCLEGGETEINTGNGFLDHMLNQLAFHSGWGMKVNSRGDTATGMHHTMEDVGIAMGEALDAALGDRVGITRYGWAIIPMDESLSTVSVDISGRSCFCGSMAFEPVNGIGPEDFSEFWKALCRSARITMHLKTKGENGHHMAESSFKATGMALKRAVAIGGNTIKSTKGRL
jgi:imidazoleglycerol phosphate dehydratase HisB